MSNPEQLPTSLPEGVKGTNIDLYKSYLLYRQDLKGNEGRKRSGGGRQGCCPGVGSLYLHGVFMGLVLCQEHSMSHVSPTVTLDSEWQAGLDLRDKAPTLNISALS